MYARCGVDNLLTSAGEGILTIHPTVTAYYNSIVTMYILFLAFTG